MNSPKSPQWCVPGDVKERAWLLIFEDADRPFMHFETEELAREAFEQANLSWNCYLFAAVERQPSLSPVASLLAALRPFAERVAHYPEDDGTRYPDTHPVSWGITLGDCRRAREVLQEAGGQAASILAPAEPHSPRFWCPKCPWSGDEAPLQPGTVIRPCPGCARYIVHDRLKSAAGPNDGREIVAEKGSVSS